MNISKLKINGFGKFQNKEMDLKPGINIVYGKNESGKSTLLKFITGMLYGLAKTKNGKEISDYEKYMPWNVADYSGKLEYKLDNNEKYEIFREFNKKITKLYDSKMDEISCNYGTDKSKGSEFFFEQTGVSEEMLFNTSVIEQEEVKLDKTEQNSILQKISNVVSTGDSKSSFKRIMDNLDKKQNKEIGTNRTTGKPLNLVTERLENAKKRKTELQQYKDRQLSSNTSKESLEKTLFKNAKEIEVLKKIKIDREKEYIENEKIQLLQTGLEELEQKIGNVLNEVTSTIKLANEKIKKGKLAICILLFLISIISYFIIPLKIISIIIFLVAIIMSVIFVMKKQKIAQSNKEKLIELRKKEELLIEEKKQREKEINEMKIKTQENIEKMISNIKYQYLGEIEVKELEYFLSLNYREIENELQNKIEMYNKDILHINSINVTNENLNEIVEQFAKAEEEIMVFTQELEELNKRNYIINLTRGFLEAAYEEMKDNITPQFMESLTKITSKITEGKYNKVQFNDVNGLVVENESGDYIKCERLSVGTIDQMYLALRLATLNEITQEKIILIFDETFVYYDNKRLENILKYINEELKEYQVIILSCSEREKNILEKNKIEYNICEL